jgi:Rrf2 family protein
MLSNTHFSMAVHVLSVLAYRASQLVGSEELAGTVGTNPSFLRGLIGQMKDAGLVETVQGKGGGTRLARAASRITLRDVYRATESRPALTTHVCDDQSNCPVARNMDRMLSSVNDRIEKVVESELKGMSVADLVASFVGRKA